MILNIQQTFHLLNEIKTSFRARGIQYKYEQVNDLDFEKRNYFDFMDFRPTTLATNTPLKISSIEAI
jgi:hypothetical protein